MKKIAVLDLGTNTFHLLIAGIAEGKCDVIYQKTIAVKLGEGGINKGFITKEAFARGIKAVTNFSEVIKRYQADEIRAAGTAALRNAENGLDFIETIDRDTGIKIQIIEGDLEAKLIYEGVRHGVKLDATTALIMDIGGGSVEFILGNSETIFWKKSYPIGAARLMDTFHHHDPISQPEIDAIHNFLNKQLMELKEACREYHPHVLIGSAGAFETFAALAVSEFSLPQDLLKETSFDFDLFQFNQISKEILSSTHAERLVNPGIVPVRVDMIVVATVLVRYILNELHLSTMKLSAFALKEGLLFS